MLVAGNSMNIKWGDVNQILFTDGDSLPASTGTKPDLSIKSNDEAANAIKSLRKLAAATDVGVNFQDYGRRVIDVKAEVEDYLTRVEDGYRKEQIRLSMQAYADAGSAWNEMIRYDFMLPEFEPAKSLQKKYSIPTVTSPGGSATMPRRIVLSTIWAIARKHIENAASSQHVDAKVINPLSSPSELAKPAVSAAPNIVVLDGSWNVNIYYGAEVTSTLFTFSKAGDGYVGNVTSPTGTTDFTKIRFDGKNFNFSFTGNMENQLVFFSGSGEVSGDFFSGTVKATAPTGQIVQANFMGTRKK